MSHGTWNSGSGGKSGGGTVKTGYSVVKCSRTIYAGLSSTLFRISSGVVFLIFTYSWLYSFIFAVCF